MKLKRETERVRSKIALLKGKEQIYRADSDNDSDVPDEIIKYFKTFSSKQWNA
jgi:hypothetical protein